jgi:hypothetical protein
MARSKPRYLGSARYEMDGLEVYCMIHLEGEQVKRWGELYE